MEKQHWAVVQKLRWLAYWPLERVETARVRMITWHNPFGQRADLFIASVTEVLELLGSAGNRMPLVEEQVAIEIVNTFADEDDCGIEKKVDLIEMLAGLALFCRADRKDKIEFVFNLIDLHNFGRLMEDQVFAFLDICSKAMSRVAGFFSLPSLDKLDELVNELFLHVPGPFDGVDLDTLCAWITGSPQLDQVFKVVDCVFVLDALLLKFNACLDSMPQIELPASMLRKSDIKHEAPVHSMRGTFVCEPFIKLILQDGSPSFFTFLVFAVSEQSKVSLQLNVESVNGKELFGSTFDLIGVGQANPERSIPQRSNEIARQTIECSPFEFMEVDISHLLFSKPSVYWASLAGVKSLESCPWVHFDSRPPEELLICLDIDQSGPRKPTNASLVVALNEPPSHIFGQSHGRRIFASEVFRNSGSNSFVLQLGSENLLLFFNCAGRSKYTLASDLDKQLKESKCTGRRLVLLANDQGPLLGSLNERQDLRRANEELLHCLGEWQRRMSEIYCEKQVQVVVVLWSQAFRSCIGTVRATSKQDSDKANILQIILNDTTCANLESLHNGQISLKNAFTFSLLREATDFAPLNTLHSCDMDNLLLVDANETAPILGFGPLVRFDGSILLESSRDQILFVAASEGQPSRLIDFREECISKGEIRSIQNYTGSDESLLYTVSSSTSHQTLCATASSILEDAESGVLFTNILYDTALSPTHSLIWKHLGSNFSNFPVNTVAHVGPLISVRDIAESIDEYICLRSISSLEESLRRKMRQNFQLLKNISGNVVLSNLLNAFVWDEDTVIQCLSRSNHCIIEDHECMPVIRVVCSVVGKYCESLVSRTKIHAKGSVVIVPCGGGGSSAQRDLCVGLDLIRDHLLYNPDERKQWVGQKIVTVVSSSDPATAEKSGFLSFVYDQVDLFLNATRNIIPVCVLWPAGPDGVAWESTIFDTASSQRFKEIIIPLAAADAFVLCTADQSNSIPAQSFDHGRFLREGIKILPRGVGFVSANFSGGPVCSVLSSCGLGNSLSNWDVNHPEAEFSNIHADIERHSTALQLSQNELSEAKRILRTSESRLEEIKAEETPLKAYFGKLVKMLRESRSQVWSQRKESAIKNQAMILAYRSTVRLTDELIQVLPNYQDEVLNEKRKFPVKEQAEAAKAFTLDHNCSKLILEIANQCEEARVMMVEKANALTIGGELRLKSDGTYAFSEGMAVAALKRISTLFSDLAADMVVKESNLKSEFKRVLERIHSQHLHKVTTVGSALTRLKEERESLIDVIATKRTEGDNHQKDIDDAFQSLTKLFNLLTVGEQ